MTAMERDAREAFEHLIGNGVSLIDFGTPWCMPCRAQEKIVAEIKRAYRGRARVEKVNIDENQDIAGRLGIQSIPTLIIFKNGREMNRFIGLQTAERLDGALKAMLT